MRRFFVRLSALFLMPALLLNPVSAWTMESRFGEEALSGRDLFSGEVADADVREPHLRNLRSNVYQGMARKPVRVTETDLESLTDWGAAELFALNRAWDTAGILPGNALAALETLRTRLHVPPWPADRPGGKMRSTQIAREVDKLHAAIREAYQKGHADELDRLNAATQTLLDERISLQLSMAEQFVRSKKISPALASMIGAVLTLDRKRVELHWQRARSYKTGQVRTIRAANWLGEAVETLGLEGWDIREKAMGPVATLQQRWKTRVIQGVTVTRREWTNIVYDSILEAFRSQIHTLDSQQEDLMDVIDHGVMMRHVELLLVRPTAQAQTSAIHHLEDISAWARRGRVEGKKYAAIELAEALIAVEKNDVDRARERIQSARKILRESRVPEIKRIRDFVDKRATAIFDQIRAERQWADDVLSIRDSLAPKELASAYRAWLDRLSGLLQKSPYAKPPEQVATALARVAPTVALLNRLPALPKSEKAATRNSIRNNIRRIRQDLAFINKLQTAP